MNALEQAQKAYFDVFKKHHLHKSKDRITHKRLARKIGDELNSSPEWISYQNAWLLEKGVKVI